MTWPRIADRMQSILDSMNTLYTSMSEKEAEAVTDMDGASLGFPKFKDELQNQSPRFCTHSVLA